VRPPALPREETSGKKHDRPWQREKSKLQTPEEISRFLRHGSIIMSPTVRTVYAHNALLAVSFSLQNQDHWMLGHNRRRRQLNKIRRGRKLQIFNVVDNKLILLRNSLTSWNF